MGDQKRLFQIRKADANDADAILACLGAAFESYRCQYTPAAFADTVLDSETIQRRLREMSLIAAISEGTIIGTIGSGLSERRGTCEGWPFCLTGKEPEWHRHYCRRLNVSF